MNNRVLVDAVRALDATGFGAVAGAAAAVLVALAAEHGFGAEGGEAWGAAAFWLVAPAVAYLWFRREN